MTCIQSISVQVAVRRLAAATLLALAMAASTATLAAGPLANPTDETMCLLYYQVAKTPAPLDAYAAQAVSVSRANEFDKPQALAAEKARLTALVASLQAVTSVRMNVDTTFGEYDSGLGEFDLQSFGADEFFSFWCPDHQQLRLRIDNGPYAQSWVLDPKTAEAALKKNGGARNVVAITTIALTSVDASAPNDPLSLVGNASSVQVEGAFNHAPLGHYDVKSN